MGSDSLYHPFTCLLHLQFSVISAAGAALKIFHYNLELDLLVLQDYGY